MKVFIIDGNYQYKQLFRNLGYETTDDLTEASLVCFTGGEDVSPKLYGDYQHKYTGNNPQRDNREEEIFNICRELDVPLVGICRGAQFLNVMSGGRMYQHVTGHTRSHMLRDEQTGEEVFVSSTHHQMMMPGKKAIIIAKSIGVDSYRQWYNGSEYAEDDSEEGIEVVFYPHTKALCFQPHPEFSVNDRDYREMAEYFEQLLDRCLSLKVPF